MAMSNYTLEKLEQIANQDMIEDFHTWYELQRLAVELCAEYRKLAGLPPAVFEDKE